MVPDPLTVLVVADDPGHTQAALQAIADLDPACIVIPASTPTLALDRLSQGGIDLILLDAAFTDAVTGAARLAPHVPLALLSLTAKPFATAQPYPPGVIDHVVIGDGQREGVARLLRYAASRKGAATALDRRLRLLREASALLEVAAYDSILEEIARLMVVWFADVSVMVRLHPDGSVEQVHLAHANSVDEQALRDLGKRIATSRHRYRRSTCRRC